MDQTAAVDWTGLPLRTASGLQRADALALLDWEGASGCEGRLRLQDEYVEWRVVRDADDGIRRVELTTELPEFWRVLAAHSPAEALLRARPRGVAARPRGRGATRPAELR